MEGWCTRKMIGLIIVIIVVLVVLGFYWGYCRKYVDGGSRFNFLVATYLAIIEESRVLEGDDIKLSNVTEIVKNGVRSVYNPEKPVDFYKQMEYLYQEAMEEYDKIKDKQLFFRSDDWEKVRLNYNALTSVYHMVRIKRWQTCGLD